MGVGVTESVAHFRACAVRPAINKPGWAFSLYVRSPLKGVPELPEKRGNMPGKLDNLANVTGSHLVRTDLRLLYIAMIVRIAHTVFLVANAVQ